jgi:hypothetical protein
LQNNPSTTCPVTIVPTYNGIYHDIFVLQLTKSDRGFHWRQDNVETAPFYISKEVDHLIKEIEVCYDVTVIGPTVVVLDNYC